MALRVNYPLHERFSICAGNRRITWFPTLHNPMENTSSTSRVKNPGQRSMQPKQVRIRRIDADGAGIAGQLPRRVIAMVLEPELVVCRDSIKICMNGRGVVDLQRVAIGNLLRDSEDMTQRTDGRAEMHAPQWGASTNGRHPMPDGSGG